MKYSFIFFFVFIIKTIFSQKEFKILSQSENTIKIEFKLPNKTFIETNLGGQNYLDFSKTFKNVTLEQGKPAMPVFGETFIIPNKGISKITISNESQFTEFEDVSVLPSKGNLKRNVKPSEVPYIFGNQYQSNEFYPSSVGNLKKPFILRTVRGQVLNIFPFQYNPITKTLRKYTKIIVNIEFDKNETGLNELMVETNPSDIISNKHLFLNSLFDKYDAVDEEGELLIITADEYSATLKPLMDWKNKKGIKTKLVKLSEIGTTAEDIKNYVQTYYNENPMLKYLILAGDSDKMPAYSYGSTWSEELYSDSYFGQLSGDDYYPEVFVGRFSGNNSDIQVMIDRIFEYEQNPKGGDWMKKAIGIASSEGAGYGDEGQADWQHMREMRTKLMNFGYLDIFEFYEGSRGGEDAGGNPTSESILAAVNEGVGLFNYTGHGDISSCITGNYSSSHVNQADNFGSYPFVVSVACNNGTFVGATCFAESWLKAKKEQSPTGAIAMCASSILMAWAPPMQTQDEMTEIITEAYQNNRKSTLGGLFYNSQMSMLEEYGVEGEEVMQTWIFFGDPSVDFRNKTTQDLTVTHVQEINSYQELTSVFESLTNDATISLSVNNQFITKGKISNGQSSILIPSMEPNTIIDVVGTKQNYKPYFGQIVVKSEANITENKLNEISIFPNPVKNFITIKFNNSSQKATFELVDITGKIVLTGDINKESNTINVSNLSEGLYTVKFVTFSGVSTKQFIKQ